MRKCSVSTSLMRMYANCGDRSKGTIAEAAQRVASNVCGGKEAYNLQSRKILATALLEYSAATLTCVVW